MNDDTDFQLQNQPTQARLREGYSYLACSVCRREIPASAATALEAPDYVAHFCGLDCFEQWRSQVGDCGHPLDESHC